MVAHALVIDHFGNVGLNVDHDRLAGTGITLGGRVEVEARRRALRRPPTRRPSPTSSPGELIVYQDAYRTLALAINRGDAAGTLGLGAGRRGAAAAAMIGTPRVHHRLTDSTNERAKELAAAGAPHGTLVTADEQSAGPRPPGPRLDGARRLGRPDVARAARADELLPLAAAVAVSEALPAEAAIKWPNDVLDRAAASSRASSWRDGPRRAGRCWGSA